MEPNENGVIDSESFEISFGGMFLRPAIMLDDDRVWTRLDLHYRNGEAMSFIPLGNVEDLRKLRDALDVLLNRYDEPVYIAL